MIGFLLLLFIYFLIGLFVISFYKDGQLVPGYTRAVQSGITWIFKIAWHVVQGLFKLLWFLVTNLFHLITSGHVRKKKRPF